MTDPKNKTMIITATITLKGYVSTSPQLLAKAVYNDLVRDETKGGWLAYYLDGCDGVDEIAVLASSLEPRSMPGEDDVAFLCKESPSFGDCIEDGEE